MRTFKPYALLLGTLVTATACGYPKSAAAPPAVSPATVARSQEKWPGATTESITAGREVFLAKCNNCHGYPDLTSEPEDEFPSIVKRMGKKAELSDKQTDDVLHFVLAARSEATASPTATSK